MRVNVLKSKGNNSLTHPLDPWNQWGPWDPWDPAESVAGSWIGMKKKGRA